MKDIVEKISLKARVAFIILCIENAVEKNSEKVKWHKVFNIFWLQTSNQFVDEWLYIVSKVMPESILEDDYEENEILTYIDYSKLKELYRNTPKYVFELMELAFECGTTELYGKVENNSERTTQFVLKAIQIMKENNVELPEIEILKKYTFAENHGWGREFMRDDLFDSTL